MPIFVDISGHLACVRRSTETKTLHGLYCRKLRRQHLCAVDIIDFLRSKNKENDCFQHKCANVGNRTKLGILTTVVPTKLLCLHACLGTCYFGFIFCDELCALEFYRQTALKHEDYEEALLSEYLKFQFLILPSFRF